MLLAVDWVRDRARGARLTGDGAMPAEPGPVCCEWSCRVPSTVPLTVDVAGLGAQLVWPRQCHSQGIGLCQPNLAPNLYTVPMKMFTFQIGMPGVNLYTVKYQLTQC